MSATGVVRTAGVPSRDCIRVASVPSGHVYVRHLSDPERRRDRRSPAGRRAAGRRGAMVAAGDARRGLDRGAPRRLRRLPRALRLRRQVARRAARHRGCAARRRRSPGPDGSRPPQSASSGRRASRRATRGAAGERCGGDHPDAWCGRDDRGTLGSGRRGPAASAHRRLGHAGAAASRALRLRRRPAREEPSGQHGRGGGGARCSPRRSPGLPGREAADRHPSRGVRSRCLRLRPGRGRDPASARGNPRSRRTPRARLLQRRRALGVPQRDRRVGAAVSLRHALRLVGGVLRPGHRGRSRRVAGSTPSSGRA